MYHTDTIALKSASSSKQLWTYERPNHKPLASVIGWDTPNSFHFRNTNSGQSDANCTLPKTNIATENRPCEKETSIPTIHFQLLLLLVSGRVYNQCFSHLEKRSRFTETSLPVPKHLKCPHVRIPQPDPSHAATNKNSYANSPPLRAPLIWAN